MVRTVLRATVATVVVVMAAGTGCGDAASASDASATATGAGDSSGGDDAASSGDSTETGQGTVEPPPSACAEPTSVTAAPETIGETIDFINALPHPVTLDCFLQQLERPVRLNATTSTVSLQPALGERSPRVFMFYGDLIMSVAIDGEPGTHLLEFGELVAPTKSIKGELEFPVTDALLPSAATERVFDEESGTTCRICHAGESEAPEYDFGFASDALAFRDIEEVSLDALQTEFETCAASDEPARCVRLTALLGFGVVEPAQFPEALQTIYDYD